MKDPTGKALGMAPEVLHLLPIGNFWLPGLFILLVFGIAPLVNASWLLYAYVKDASANNHSIDSPLKAAFIIGLVLIGWMMGQFVLIGYMHPVQLFTTFLGATLTAFTFPKVVRR